MEKELIEKKNDLITKFEKVMNEAKEQKRELTEAEAEELAEIRDNVRRIIKTLGIKEDFDKMTYSQMMNFMKESPELYNEYIK